MSKNIEQCKNLKLDQLMLAKQQGHYPDY